MGKKKESSDVKVLRAYMTMILDGSAFSNWENKPDRQQRYDLVESILKDTSYRGQPLDVRKIQKIVTESENTKQLKRMMEEMFIDEDEFKV